MGVTGDEDSEWEYEYDDNETEDFYIVLELPTNATAKPQSRKDDLFAAHDPTKPRKGAAAGKKRKQSSNEDEQVTIESQAATTIGADDTLNQPLLDGLQNLALAATASKNGANAKSKSLQIMDLESDEPVIMYQGQMYSCQWASSIGSDLLFSRPPAEPKPDYRPLREFKDVDLLGIAAAKLVASPATIERKADYTGTSTDGPTNATSIGTHNDILRHANFLNRIADIKAARGEPTGNLKSLAESVMAHPERYAPETKARIPRTRRAASNISASRRADAAAAAAAAAAARSQGSPSTVAETPTIASTRARRASTQSVSTPTPARWADLEEDEDQDMVDE